MRAVQFLLSGPSGPGETGTGHGIQFLPRNLEGSACTCNPRVGPSAHTSTHNRSSEAPAGCKIGRFRSELVEITTAWKYSFMPVK